MSTKKPKQVPRAPQSKGLLKRLSHSRDSDYRENPERAIYVFGEINANLVRQLTPNILNLRKGSDTRPITVYIDSPGGSIQSYEHLEGLLFNEDQDGNKCRIITVVTSYAASAAARLLARGDYSMAYKNATIHCHGTRFEAAVITKERAESMAESLALFNEEMSKDFAHKILESLAWLYRFNSEAIEKESTVFQNNHIVALSQIIRKKLVGKSGEILDCVMEELITFVRLEAFLQKSRRSKLLSVAEKKGNGYRDVQLLKLIAEFLESLMGQGEKKSGLQQSKLNELIALYSLRRSYYERFIADCDDAEPLLMMYCGKAEIVEADKIKDASQRKAYLFEKSGKDLFGAWQLATTLSTSLAKGENSLTASDAYWLGLIEEVVGDKELCSRRQLQEAALA